MITFTYTIKDKLGIHARPAGMLSKLAKEFVSEIYVCKDERSALATRVIAIMGMGILYGDKITVTVSGIDEKEAAATIENYFKENL